MDKDQFRVSLVEQYLELIDPSKQIFEGLMGRSILVTGGAGAIGSNLVVALSLLVGNTGLVTVLDNLSAINCNRPWNVPSLDNVLFVLGDVRSDKDIKRVFREKPTIVFHLAAYFANQNSVDHPETSAEVDVLGLIKVLEQANLASIERFIYASSGCAIYGSSPDLPVKEDFVSLKLTTPYQANKMTGEMYCNFYNHHYGLSTVNCRFFNSYGPGEVPGQYRNVIPNFIFWTRGGYALPITGDGSETRDFTYVLDLVQGLLKAAVSKQAVGENFNLAAGREVSILELAEMIQDKSGSERALEFRQPRKWDTKKRMLASISKAQELIDYKPMVTLAEGLEQNFAWFDLFHSEINESTDFPSGINSALGKKLC